MKNHRKDYSYYSGCIAGDGDLLEAVRPPGFDKRIGGASHSRANLLYDGEFPPPPIVCKLLTGCCSCRDGIKLKLEHFEFEFQK